MLFCLGFLLSNQAALGDQGVYQLFPSRKFHLQSSGTALTVFCQLLSRNTTFQRVLAWDSWGE